MDLYHVSLSALCGRDGKALRIVNLGGRTESVVSIGLEC